MSASSAGPGAGASPPFCPTPLLASGGPAGNNHWPRRSPPHAHPTQAGEAGGGQGLLTVRGDPARASSLSRRRLRTSHGPRGRLLKLGSRHKKDNSTNSTTERERLLLALVPRVGCQNCWCCYLSRHCKGRVKQLRDAARSNSCSNCSEIRRIMVSIQSSSLTCPRGNRENIRALCSLLRSLPPIDKSDACDTRFPFSRAADSAHPPSLLPKKEPLCNGNCRQHQPPAKSDMV